MYFFTMALFIWAWDMNVFQLSGTYAELPDIRALFSTLFPAVFRLFTFVLDADFDSSTCCCCLSSSEDCSLFLFKLLVLWALDGLGGGGGGTKVTTIVTALAVFFAMLLAIRELRRIPAGGWIGENGGLAEAGLEVTYVQLSPSKGHGWTSWVAMILGITSTHREA